MLAPYSPAALGVGGENALVDTSLCLGGGMPRNRKKSRACGVIAPLKERLILM